MPIHKVKCNLGPLHTRDWEPMTSTLQPLSLVEKAELVKFASHYVWGTNGTYKWMHDGCKVYMNPTWHRMDHVSVTWIYFKNYLLEVGLTQNRNTMALWTLTTVILFYFNMCEDPTWTKLHWNSSWSRTRSHMTSHHTWGPVTTLHDVEGVLGRPLDTFFWALTISRLRLLARVWSGSYPNAQSPSIVFFSS